ncbi:MAG: site-specific DNA-methyltransferase (adenine-specific) [Psychroserpens sp.]
MKLKPVYSNRGVDIYQGDCVEVMHTLKQNKSLKLSSVVTSPPYANQRKLEYKSISPDFYPSFTSNYFEAIRPLLKIDGSIFIVIRPNISKGEIDDFVLRTRLKIREKWTECEELIWIKPNSAPLGSIKRPRRSWESILWYGQSGAVYCDTKCDNTVSDRIGFLSSKKHQPDVKNVIGTKKGISRTKDYISVGTQRVQNGLCHPAIFPIELPSWLIRLSTRKGEVVLDPFMGSGSTAIACLKEKRKFVGIELDSYYIESAIKRIESELVYSELQLELQLEMNESAFKLTTDTVRNSTIIEF